MTLMKYDNWAMASVTSESSQSFARQTKESMEGHAFRAEAPERDSSDSEGGDNSEGGNNGEGGDNGEGGNNSEGDGVGAVDESEGGGAGESI